MKKSIVTFLMLSSVLLLTSASLWATNGAQFVGFTAIQESLGGSGVAYPQDTSTILVNPAGLTELPRLANFNLLVGFPSSKMNTAPAAGGIGNAAGEVSSDNDPVILPAGAFNLPTHWFHDKFSLGLGFFSVAGFTVDYPISRLGANVLGPAVNTFDKHTSYSLFKIVPTAAYQINDQWSIGLGFHIDYSQLSTNSAVPVAFTPTTGDNRTDTAFGVGVGFGVLYKPFDRFSLGVSYVTEQWMQDFSRYKDILPQGLNYPQQVIAGISVIPFKQFLINTDFHWINWSGASGGFGTPVAQGGLEWQDQFIGKIGLQYQPIKLLVLRAGYNYGRSAVPNGSVFVDELSSVVGEHNLTGGIGFKFFDDKANVDFAYLRTFGKTITDDGSQIGGAGAGSTIEQSSHALSAEFGLKF